MILLVGCKADIKPIEKEEVIVEEEPEEVEEMPEVPEDWEGKTIKELLEEGNAPDVVETPDNTEDNETEEEPKEILPSDVTKISLQMYGDSMQFFPNTVTISLGETVRWINELDYHDKKARVSVYAHHNSLFRSPMLNYGEHYEFTFNEKGSYSYGAVPYESFFRRGTVIVE